MKYDYDMGIVLSNDINIKAVIDFLSRCKENNCNIHNLEIVKNNEKILSFSVPPYKGNEKMQLYSMSKSFTATAIGILFSESRLSLNEKIVDIFPEKCPENISEYMMQINIKHLLSMNTGHEKCPIEKLKNSKNFISDFMNTEVKYKPGTHFAYNNAATYLLSEIVTHITKMSMFDFLCIKLFEPLGISDVYWDTFSDGCQQGAIGLHASVEDVSKLGQLYLNNGVWNGKKILSEEWIKYATSCVSDTSTNGTPDWTSGYGFQIWKNSIEGYRFDGAFGQFCLVIPDKKMVVSFQEEAWNPQFAITEAFNMIYTLFAYSQADKFELINYINSINDPKLYINDCDIIQLPNELYCCESNKYGITLIKFEQKDGNIVFSFSNGQNWQKIISGNGKYVKSSFILPYFKVKIREIMENGNCERNDILSFFIYKRNMLDIRIFNLDSPNSDKILFDFNDECILMVHGDERIVFKKV